MIALWSGNQDSDSGSSRIQRVIIGLSSTTSIIRKWIDIAHEREFQTIIMSIGSTVNQFIVYKSGTSERSRIIDILNHSRRSLTGARLI